MPRRESKRWKKQKGGEEVMGFGKLKRVKGVVGKGD